MPQNKGPDVTLGPKVCYLFKK